MQPPMIIIALCLASAALLVAFVAFTAHRSGVRALSHWLLAWSAILTAACIALLIDQYPAIHPVSFLFSSVAAPLMLIGAYHHVEREVPSWILPTAFLLVVVRLSSFQLGVPEAARVIALVVEPGLALLAAAVTLDRSGREVAPLTTSRKLLAMGFVVYGLAEGIDAYTRLFEGPLSLIWGGWFVAGAPLFAIQTGLYIDQMGRNAQAIVDQAESHARRLALVTASSRDVLLEVDEHGEVTWVSESIESALGRSPADMVGRSVLELFGTPEESQLVRILRDRGRLTEEDLERTPLQSERRHVLPDGSERWLESTATCYRTAGGALRVITRTRDVTARVASQQAIRESEQRLNRAEQIASLGSWEYYPRREELLWSDHLFRLHGLEPCPGPVDESVVRPLIVEEDLERMLGAASEIGRTHAYPRFEYRIRRADTGELRRIRVLGEVDLEEDGEILRAIGACIDVTEQVRVEELLRRGREHLDLLVNSDIVGVFYARADGTITEANDAFLTPLGYGKSDLPLSLGALTSPEQQERDAAAREEMRRTGRTNPFERDYVSRGGDRIPMLVGAILLDPDQGVALGIALDLSERKRAEAYIARYQQELEKTVAERTRELVESRNRLMEADRLAAVGTLTAGVAHQINNPIGAILNSAEYALLCREDADALETFERALRSNLTEARRCAQIVRGMLQFARDEPTAKWVEDLNRVTRRAHRAISAYAQDRAAKVDIQAPPEPILARISPIEIEQAIVNVLRNAIESGDAVSIEISLAARDEHAVIEIVDNGRGIADADRDRLVEPFYSTRTREGGTGLGLSVAHGIISDHGGEIRIDSIEDRGTCVTLTLPLVDGASAEPI